MRKRLLAAATVAASLVPAAPAAAGDPIMPLAEVRAGMQCTGYSVVRGTSIASFRVDVIDVIAGEVVADQPRILVEASGPAVDATGIGPGFSGTPIYCRDRAGVERNIGAIAESVGEFGGKVVLATPIESMLANPVDPPRARRRATVASRAGRPASPRAAAAIRRIREEGTRPLAGPLTVSGVSEPLARALRTAGERIGRPVLTVPAGPLGGFPPQQLRPGAAVAVGYSSGDLRLSGVGTVSYTDGDRVWALGHQFEGAGARALLLQDAYVFDVINEPNAALTGGSYKLAVPGHDLGTLTNDAFAAVVGRIGAPPPTVPVRVIADDLDTRERSVLDVTVADETDVDNPTGFSPLSSVAPLAIAQAAGTVLRSSPGRLTGTMCLRIVFRERPKRPARFCNRYVSSTTFDPAAGALGNSVGFSAAIDALDAVTLIETHQGRAPHVARLEAKLTLRRGERLAHLRRVKAPRRVRPGATVPLRVTVQRVRGGKITRTHRVRIPRDVRPGRRALTLVGVREQTPDEGLLAILLGFGDDSRGAAPPSLEALIASIRALERWDGVRIRLGGTRGRAFRDDRLLIAGRAQTRVRVVGR